MPVLWPIPDLASLQPGCRGHVSIISGSMELPGCRTVTDVAVKFSKGEQQAYDDIRAEFEDEDKEDEDDEPGEEQLSGLKVLVAVMQLKQLPCRAAGNVEQP